MTLDSLLLILEKYQTLTLLILFLGAYFETLIVSSFLIYGEFFFLAGGILAGLGNANLLLVVFVLYAGGILGDHTSYWIGRRCGSTLYLYLQEKPLFRRFFTELNYDRGIRFFEKYGGWSVFMGRFLGPVSWITPFLAGIFKVSYVRFTLFDIPAVILGIGQFILLGYLFGRNYHAVLAVAQQYFLIVLFALVCVAAILYYYRRLLQRLNITIRNSLLHFFTQLRAGNRAVIRHTLKVIGITILGVCVLYVLVLMIVFFVENQRLNGAIKPDLDTSFVSVDQIIHHIDSTIYYKNGTQNMGAINVVMITDEPLDELLQRAGWNRNKTFVRDTVGFASFFEQAEDNIFPISDLYFEGVPQNYAYQYTDSTLTTRQHLRVWNYGTYLGTPVYVLAVSKDIGFDVYRSLSFIIPYHAIDPNIDASRALLTESIKASEPTVTETDILSPLGAQKNDPSLENIYYTDGMISLLQI